MKRIAALILALTAILMCGCTQNAPKLSVSLEAGQSLRLDASEIYEKLGDDAVLTWTSDDENVASVTSEGVVNYVGYGKTTVRVEAKNADGNKTEKSSYSINCLIDNTIDGLVFDKEYIYFTEVGQTEKITPSVLLDVDEFESFESSDEKIASVSSDGTVTYVAPGRAEITGKTKQGYTAKCFVMCDSVLMKLGDVEITDSMYGYWVSSYKTQVVEYNIGVDDEQVWNEQIDDSGKTFKELFDESVYTSVEQILAAVYSELSENKGEIPVEVSDTVSLQIATAQDYNNGEQNLEEILSNFYVNTEMLSKIFAYEELTNRYSEKLFAEDGENAITDNDVKTYFDDNYYHVKYVAFSTKYNNDDLDSMTELNETQIEENKKAANEIYTKLLNSEMKIEDAADLDYDYDDYVFEDNGTYEEIFINTVKDMKDGEIKKIESDYAVYVVKKEEKTEEDFTDEVKEEINRTIQDKRLADSLDQYISQIEADREKIMSEYDVVSAPMFSDYSY